MKRFALLPILFLGLVGCNEDSDRAICDAANTFDFDGGAYCIVIEEGFLSADCPDEFPEGREFDDFTVCTDEGAVPDEVEDEARRRGFGEPICEEGDTRPAGDGCNTCECSGGDWSCTEMACEITFEECLAACVDCEDPAQVSYVGESQQECSVIDYQCDEGQLSFNNECGCGCMPDVEPLCTDGDTRMESCNECVCTGGAWVCDTQDCTELEACLEACGVGCAEPQFQVCSVDGESYCSDCAATCYGAELADDREPCDCTPPSGSEVTVRELILPEGCVDNNPGGGESGVARNIFEAAAWFTCEAGVSIDVASGEEVLMRAVFNEQPEADLSAYRNNETDEYVVYMTAPQYCGGPPPQATIRYVYAPFGDETAYLVETCTHTMCEEFMP